jgi:hypothetical protein
MTSVTATLNFLAKGDDSPEVRIYPPSSGRATSQPALSKHAVQIRDARLIKDQLRLDEHGFSLHTEHTSFVDYYDDVAVRAHYYLEVQAQIKKLLKAHTAIVFDHNVRSVARAARGDRGVQPPVDQVHNDYNETTGPKRAREILLATDMGHLVDHHFAFVNLWRPIVGPVLDNALAVCDARSVAATDLVATSILHFGDDNLIEPRHRGGVQSVRYSAGQQWHYVSAMQPNEFLLLKCYDSRLDGRARFLPHTGFDHPSRPVEFKPRESIEARTLVVFDSNAYA